MNSLFHSLSKSPLSILYTLSHGQHEGSLVHHSYFPVVLGCEAVNLPKKPEIQHDAFI